MADQQSTERTQFRRHPERGSYDPARIRAVLDSGLVCHLGFVDSARPRVIPTLYGRIGDTLYLHGSSASSALRTAGGGLPVCVTVSIIDALVLARSVFSHSVNYRSVVIYGTATTVDDRDEKAEALRAIVEHVIPERWDHAQPPTRKELAATAVVKLPITESSVKIRSGGPLDADPDELETPVWAGTVPIRTVFGHPREDSVNPPAVAVPDHVVRLAGAEVGFRRDPRRASELDSPA